MARKEPFIDVKEEIKSSPATANLDNSANVGLVIVSDYGKKLDYVTGPSEFLQKYTADGVTIPRNAHISWYNAYFMSQFSALVISKAMNMTAAKSLMIYSVKPNRTLVPNATPFLDANYVWYKDNHYLDNKLDWSFDLTNSADGAFAIVINETVYYSGITEVDLLAQYPAYGNYNLFIKLSDIIWSGDTESEVMNSISNVISELNSIVSSFEDVTVETITPTYTVALNPGTNKYEVSSISIESIIYFTNDGIRKDEGITSGYCGYTLVEWDEDEVVYTSDLKSVITVSADFSGMDSLTGANSIWGLLYNDILIHHGSFDELSSEIKDAVTSDTKVYKISDNNQFNQIISRFKSSEVDIIDYSESDWTSKKLTFGFLTSATETSPLSDPVIYGNYNDEVVTCTVTVTYGDLVDATHFDEDAIARFSIYTNDNAVTNYKSTKIEKVSEDTFNLAFEDNEYLCSLDPDAVDVSGVSIDIEYINTLELGFLIEVFNREFNESYDIQTPVSGIKATYGSGLDRVESSKIVYLNAAASLLAEQDLYDIAYLFNSGVTDLTFINRLSVIGKANYWFLPLDVPYNLKSPALIMNYFRNLAIDTSNSIAVGPFDRNQSLTGWVNLIAGSALYYQRLMANRANRNEFAPIYEETYGVLTYSDPVKNLTKPQREAILSFSRPINYVSYVAKNNIYVLNNNLTHQSVSNVMDEENNRRLLNYINRSAKLLMKQFISRNPQSKLVRDRIKEVFEKWMDDNVMIGEYQPDAYVVSTELVPERPNYLKVIIKIRFAGSLKYIDILSQAYPMGVDFSN